MWLLSTTLSLGVALAVLSIKGERARMRYALASNEPSSCPPASVIVPVKGWDEGLAQNLGSLAALDYPDYELIVTVRSAEDAPRGVLPRDARLVIAGESPPDRSEKCNNLLAGVAAARGRSELFAFADSDGRVSRGWLRALAAGLEKPNAGAATGYRWHVPTQGGFWSLLRSVWNGVIAGGYGPGDNPFAWGGAMAIRRETFENTNVADYWKAAVSDDYSLSEAVHASGMHIVYAPGALVATLDHTGAREFLGWIRRQLIITRVSRPGLWSLGLVSHVVYCAAMVAGVVAIVGGSISASVLLAVQLGIGMWKGRNRLLVARHLLPEHADWFRRCGWVHIVWVPLGTWVWLYGLLASAAGSTIRWRGRTYRIRAPRAVAES